LTVESTIMEPRVEKGPEANKGHGGTFCDPNEGRKQLGSEARQKTRRRPGKRPKNRKKDQGSDRDTMNKVRGGLEKGGTILHQPGKNYCEA